MDIYCGYGSGMADSGHGYENGVHHGGHYNSRNDGHYYGRDDGLDDMMKPVTNCKRFERRYDFNMFNMSDYMSCENCRHLSADNRCIAAAYGRQTANRTE